MVFPHFCCCIYSLACFIYIWNLHIPDGLRLSFRGLRVLPLVRSVCGFFNWQFETPSLQMIELKKCKDTRIWSGKYLVPMKMVWRVRTCQDNCYILIFCVPDRRMLNNFGCLWQNEIIFIAWLCIWKHECHILWMWYLLSYKLYSSGVWQLFQN